VKGNEKSEERKKGMVEIVFFFCFFFLVIFACVPMFRRQKSSKSHEISSLLKRAISLGGLLLVGWWVVGELEFDSQIFREEIRGLFSDQ